MTPRATVDWWFRSRVDGRVVVGQVPNAALAVWIGAVVWRVVADPSGPQRTLLDGVAAGALMAWALDEVVRGVNPFRRLLGVVVLVPTLVGTIMRVT